MNFVICRVCHDILVRDDEKHGGICMACLAHQTAGVRPSLDEQIQELETVSADARENWHTKRSDAERLAMRFHEAYERLAPSFGYKTKEASAKPWSEVPEQNKALMIAVCTELLAAVRAERREEEAEMSARPSDRVALRCDECGGIGVIEVNEGSYSICGDCGGTGISKTKRLRVQIDLMECTNCGKQALGFSDLRITSHKCSGGWRVTKSFMASFSIQELLLNMEGSDE